MATRQLPDAEQGDKAMCDYSLHHVATTPAKVGDILITATFPTSITRGFCAVGAPDIAVCVPPGAELSFERDVERERAFPFLRRRKVAGREARFRQINLHDPHAHHDALEFADGRVVLLTDLAPGQHATVLQLPVTRMQQNESVATPGALIPRHAF